MRVKGGERGDIAVGVNCEGDHIFLSVAMVSPPRDHIHHSDGFHKQANSVAFFPVTTMTIHRRFEPDEDALDQLVEALYELLLQRPSNDLPVESHRPKTGDR
jgi:hypothetical protein